MIVVLHEPGENQKHNYIKIDKWDSYSADVAIAKIATPLLKQLKETKQGAPQVDQVDVPEELRMTPEEQRIYSEEHQTDLNWFLRYEHILDEMIWSLNEIAEHSPGESKFFDSSLVNEEDDIMKQIQDTKLDHEGLKKYQNRVSNGTRLFGKYFQSLWD